MFKITDGKGFQITFENGWTVSVQWGCGNYADHYATPYTNGAHERAGKLGSKTAEIAAWDADGNWHSFGTDTVAPYRTPEEVAAIISLIAGK